MKMMKIPPDDVKKVLSPRAFDVFNWLLWLKQDINFVGKDIQENFFEFHCLREYQNKYPVLFRLLVDLRRPDPVAHLIIISDVGCFYLDGGERDAPGTQRAVRDAVRKYTEMPIEVNNLKDYAFLLELLMVQLNTIDLENQYKFALSPLDDAEVGGKKVFILKVVANFPREANLSMEMVAKLSNQFDDIVEIYLSLCDKYRFTPFIKKSDRKPEPDYYQ